MSQQHERTAIDIARDLHQLADRIDDAKPDCPERFVEEAGELMLEAHRVGMWAGDEILLHELSEAQKHHDAWIEECIAQGISDTPSAGTFLFERLLTRWFPHHLNGFRGDIYEDCQSIDHITAAIHGAARMIEDNPPNVPPMNPTDEKVAAIIRESPGLKGDEIAERAGLTGSEHFRRLFRERLRPRGYFNAGNGRGYFPPEHRHHVART